MPLSKKPTNDQRPISHLPLSDSSSHVVRSAALVALFLAADKLLGVVREAAVSHTFGTSAVLDAYFAAKYPRG